MDKYNETREATTNKVKFSITPEGKIEFDAEGLDQWQLNDALHQVAEQGNQQRRAAQKIKEVTLTSEFFMHCLALGFISVVALGTGFTLSRIVSGSIQSGSQSGVVQGVR